MDVYINGEFATTTDYDVQEALREIARSLSPGFGLGRCWLDGVCYAGVDSLAGAESVRPERLDAEVLSARDLANQVAETLQEYLERVSAHIENTSTCLRLGQVDAISNLEPLVSALGYIEAARDAIRAADERYGVKAHEAFQGTPLGRYLEDVVSALERRDFVEAAGILEYMLKPELEVLASGLLQRQGAMQG